MKNGGSFHSYVKLPEGNIDGFPEVNIDSSMKRELSQFSRSDNDQKKRWVFQFSTLVYRM
jgi:hypothetical protein